MELQPPLDTTRLPDSPPGLSSPEGKAPGSNTVQPNRI